MTGKILFIGFTLLTTIKINAQLENFEWLIGQWEQKTKNSITVEAWNKRSNSTFEGTSNTQSLKSNSKTFSESLRILNMDSCKYYLAKVLENEFPIPFKISTESDTSFVAENRFHDFPQRIGYFKKSEDSLLVKISKIHDPNSVRTFHFKKIVSKDNSIRE